MAGSAQLAHPVASLLRSTKTARFDAERELCPGVGRPSEGILSDEHQRQEGHRVHICLHFLKHGANAPVAAPYTRNETFVEELK